MTRLPTHPPANPAGEAPWLLEWAGSITPLYWSERLRIWTRDLADAARYLSPEAARLAKVAPPPRDIVDRWEDWPAKMEAAHLLTTQAGDSE